MEEALKNFDLSQFLREIWETLTLVATSLGLYEWSMLAAIAVLVFASSYFLRKMRPKIIVAFEGPSGQTVITQSAAAELVRRACEGISDIGKVSSTLKDSKRLLIIDIRFKMHTGCKLDAVSRDLVEKVEGSIRDTLNVTKKIKINPRLQGFIGTPVQERPSYLEATPDAPAPVMQPYSEPEPYKPAEPEEKSHTDNNEEDTLKPKQQSLEEDEDWGLDLDIKDGDEDDAAKKKDKQ